MFLMPLLAGCSHTPSVQSMVAPITYKIDLQQGNVVTQEMVAKLRQGMTPPQVRYVVGSPLVTDPFHPDRWDYVYLYEKGHKVTEHHRLTVIFIDGKLARLEGDVELQDTLQAPEQTPDTPAAMAAPTPAAVPSIAVPAHPAASAQTTNADKPADTVPVTPASAQPVATQTGAAQPNVAKQPNVTTPPPAAMPVADSTQTNPPTNEADATKSSDDQNSKQRGFFGRMLDKIGL